MERSGATAGSAKEILSILKSLKTEIRQRYRAEVKGIFGSYVRGEQKEGSDIDVLVEFDEGANLLDLTGLSMFLEVMDAIEKFVEGIDFDRFQNDDLISSAVIRKFEVIGEASKNIPLTNKVALD